MRRLLAATLLFMVCAHAQECLPREFFPKNVSPQYQQQQSEQYSAHLRELDEPCLYPLAQLDPMKETYRFEWGGSRHYLKTILVRVEVNLDGSGTALIKARKERGGHIPGEMPKDEVKPLSKEKIDELRKIVQDFWAMPYSDNVEGFDGTSWFLEAVRAGKFHAVDRWSPHGRDKRFHRIGEFFLYKIANVKINHEYLN